MVYIMLYGYTKPYKHQAANILEVVLAVDTLILLMPSNTSQIRDSLSGLSFYSIDDCMQTETQGVTGLVAAMAVFYYTPLVILLLAITGVPVNWLWWVIMQVRLYIYISFTNMIIYFM